jgi:hypothetical protein
MTTMKQSLLLTMMNEASGTMMTDTADATMTTTVTTDATTTTTVLCDAPMRTTNPPGAAPAIDTTTGPKNANALCPVAPTGLAVPPKKNHPLALPSLLSSNGMMIFLTEFKNTAPFNSEFTLKSFFCTFKKNDIFRNKHHIHIRLCVLFLT